MERRLLWLATGLALAVCVPVALAQKAAGQCPPLLIVIEALDQELWVEALKVLGASYATPELTTDPEGRGLARRRLAQACPKIYHPVCGLDGQRYNNDCLAEAAGTEVGCEGPCPCAPLPPAAEPPAPRRTEERVEVAAAPVMCPMIYAPVCSVVGADYASDCTARAAGAAVACQGACPCPDLLGKLTGSGGVMLVPSDAAILAALDSANTTVDAWLADAEGLAATLAHHVVVAPEMQTVYANATAATQAGDAVTFSTSAAGALTVEARDAGTGATRSAAIRSQDVNQGCRIFAVVADVFDLERDLTAG